MNIEFYRLELYYEEPSLNGSLELIANNKIKCLPDASIKKKVCVIYVKYSKYFMTAMQQSKMWTPFSRLNFLTFLISSKKT